MNGILESLNTVFNTFGSAVFVPVMLFIIAMALGTGAKKAFFSAVYAGVGLVGFGFVRHMFFPDSTRPQLMIDYWAPEGTRIQDVAHLPFSGRSSLAGSRRPEKRYSVGRKT